ncbi:MAG: ABC transporter, partial [Pseudomonadota bacterium]|nr:ABC transporter [Pseudomonadota bacterium]
ANPESSDLKKLLGAWGVEITENKVAGDRSLARLVNAGTDRQLIPAPYITWLQLGDANISRTDLVTSNLNRLNLASAGAITLKEDAQLQGEPLFWTTPESQLVDVKHISGQRPDIQGMVERFAPSGERKVLAMRLTGSVKSAFPDGPPKPKAPEKPAEKESEQPKESEEAAAPAEEEKPKPRPHVAESEVPLNLIVVADTDMLSNAFWVQAREFFGRRFTVPVANNGDFVLNAVENLSGTSDLIGLRSRGTARRPFTKVKEMAKAAQEQFQAEEQQLMRQLEETEKKLVALQGGPAGAPQGGAAGQTQLTPEQEVEVEKFTEEMLATRKALRQVRHNLKKDIEGLRNRLSFLNVALVPILVTVAAGGLGAARMRRRRRAVVVTE